MVRAGDAGGIDPAPFQAALAQAEGQLARDTALLENARLDLERYKEAFSKNAIPKQLLDTQLSTLHQYEGAVKLDQGQVDNAKVQLAYCRIAAPITGRVGLRLVDAGNIVHASDTNPLVVITELQTDHGHFQRGGGLPAANPGKIARGKNLSSMHSTAPNKTKLPLELSRRSTTKSTRPPARSSSRPSSRTRTNRFSQTNS